MSEPSLPDEGAVLVVSSAEQSARWAPRVAERNSSGQRTALLVADAGEGEVQGQVAAMAAEVFRGAPYVVVDSRGGA